MQTIIFINRLHQKQSAIWWICDYFIAVFYNNWGSGSNKDRYLIFKSLERIVDVRTDGNMGA